MAIFNFSELADVSLMSHFGFEQVAGKQLQPLI